MKTIRVYDTSQDRLVTVEKIEKSEAEWEKLLTRQQYDITARKGTESPGSRTFDEVHGPGIFQCLRCANDLFRSSARLKRRRGWPSFAKPVSPYNIVEKPDTSLGLERTEVLCARCDSHLGHVFNDGPTLTGKRYCMNGFALGWRPKTSHEPESIEVKSILSRTEVTAGT